MDRLDLSQASSDAERENFRKLDAEFRTHPILAGEWRKFALDFEAAGTRTLKHRLGYVPKDVLVTFNTAGASFTYSSFTQEEITITATGAGTLRFLLGRMG